MLTLRSLLTLKHDNAVYVNRELCDAGVVLPIGFQGSGPEIHSSWSPAFSDVETACQMETEGFSKIFGSPINRSLLNVFFLTDRMFGPRSESRRFLRGIRNTRHLVGAGEGPVSEHPLRAGSLPRGAPDFDHSVRLEQSHQN